MHSSRRSWSSSRTAMRSGRGLRGDGRWLAERSRFSAMLTRASLRYYAATNVLVVLGVAIAVAVLAGALLVGASVRESLREIALGRLGATDAIVTSRTFFRTALGDELISRSPQQITGV